MQKFAILRRGIFGLLPASFPFIWMGLLLMRIHIWSPGEFLRTIRAFVWFFTGVSSYMILNIIVIKTKEQNPRLIFWLFRFLLLIFGFLDFCQKTIGRLKKRSWALTFNEDASLNALPHIGHGKRSVPCTTRMCFFNAASCGLIRWQCGHSNGSDKCCWICVFNV